MPKCQQQTDILSHEIHELKAMPLLHFPDYLFASPTTFYILSTKRETVEDSQKISRADEVYTYDLKLFDRDWMNAVHTAEGYEKKPEER